MTPGWAYGGNSVYRYGMWWVYYDLNPDVAGVWTLEFLVNSHLRRFDSTAFNNALLA
jgi:hypothetical protein